MDSTQLAKAKRLSYNYKDVKLTPKNMRIFHGFATSDFSSIEVTIEEVAKLIRFMCWVDNEGIKHDWFDIIKNNSKKFIIKGETNE